LGKDDPVKKIKNASYIFFLTTYLLVGKNSSSFLSVEIGKWLRLRSATPLLTGSNPVAHGVNVNRLTKNTKRDFLKTPLHRYVRCRVETQ
jgi:hypothetical protein